MPVKVAIIGAGSIGFSRVLMQDILAAPELADAEFYLTDINKKNLDMVTRLAKKDIKENKLPAKVFSSTNRRKMLEGVNYIINSTRIGGLEAFKTDVEIPLKYGIDQCVGDTLCAGGIMYGQRNIAQILDFCEDINEVSESGALFLSYSNPNAMNTWAANKYGKVDCVGLCHGVEGGHRMIASVIELMINKGKNKNSKAYKKVTTKDVDIICAGINHQTWYIKALYDGEDWSGKLLEGFEAHPEYSRTQKTRIDVMRRFGYFSTESNGHLSEYLPWYRKRGKDMLKWVDKSVWIHGETAGYLRECTETRNWFETDFPKWMATPSPKISKENISAEHGGRIIESLETGRVYRGNFNRVNNGIISNLPDDCIIEAPGYVDKNGINMPHVGDLPLGAAAICTNSINVQRLAVEAAVHGDVNLLKQAMLLDPLTGAVCMPDEISRMTDEMLVAQAKWLPQYKKEIPAAKKRLAATRKMKLKPAKGFRNKLKNIHEIRKVRTVAGTFKAQKTVVDEK